MNVAPFVIDIGSNVTKAELAGSQIPVSYKTEVGMEKYSKNTTTSSSSSSLLMGKELESHRSVSTIFRPIEHGNIVNKSHVESLLRHIVVDSAKILPSEHSFLLTEAVDTSDAQRKHLAEFLFEDLKCSSIIFGVQPVLGLHATGKSSGIVLDCGAGVTQTAAIYDNYVIREACKRVDFGGNDVSVFLRNQLKTHHKQFFDENFPSTSSIDGKLNNNNNGEWDCIQDMKRKLVKIPSSQQDNKTSSSCYTLPDGTELQNIDSKITQESIGEIFFPSSTSFISPFYTAYRNSSSNSEFSSPSSSSSSFSLSEFVVRDTLKKCDINIRSKLCESVHLIGGTTLMKNFAERFAMEFANLIPPSSTVRVHASNGRENAAWIGGNVMCQLSSSVLNFGVTRSQYLEEGGGNVLLKKKLIG